MRLLSIRHGWSTSLAGDTLTITFRPVGIEPGKLNNNKIFLFLDTPLSLGVTQNSADICEWKTTLTGDQKQAYLDGELTLKVELVYDASAPNFSILGELVFSPTGYVYTPHRVTLYTASDVLRWFF